MTERVICDKADLVAIADMVRAATGSTDTFNVGELKTAVTESNHSFVDLTGDTVTAAKMLSGTTAHDKSGAKITGTIESLMMKNPTLHVGSDGTIFATTELPEGYYKGNVTAENGAKKQIMSATYSMPTQAEQTILPGTSDQTIAAGKYLTGAQTIKGDANLVPGNIASGVSIFGVVGIASGGAGDTITIVNDTGYNAVINGIAANIGESVTVPKNTVGLYTVVFTDDLTEYVIDRELDGTQYSNNYLITKTPVSALYGDAFAFYTAVLFFGSEVIANSTIRLYLSPKP